MGKKIFDYDEVVAVAREVIAGNEDYVYEPPEAGVCVYVEPSTNGPSCVVGHIVAKLDPKAFAKIGNYEETEGSFPASCLSTNSALETVPHIFPPAAANFVSALQNAQDSGNSWGEALAYALGTGDYE